MYFVTLSLLVFIQTIKATPEILLFARDGLSELFALEMPLDATVQDLHDVIVRQQHVNTNTCEVVLSFQGEQLDDLQASLADTGISMQSTIDFNVVLFMPLCLHSTRTDDLYTGNTCSQHFIHDDVTVNPSDLDLHDQPLTLYWNRNKDLTQFNTMHFKYIEFKLHAADGNMARNRHRRLLQTMHYTEPDASKPKNARTHSFWIVPTQDVDEDVLAIDITGDVLYSSDLRQTKYAQDMVLKPSRNQFMLLAVHAFRDGEQSGLLDVDYDYAVPEGYSLLLKHEPNAYPAIINLKNHRGDTSQSDENQNVSLDTADDFGVFVEYKVPGVDWSIRWMDPVSVHFMLYDEHGKCKNVILFSFAAHKTDRYGHSFWIRPIDEIRQQHNIGQFKPGTDVSQFSDLDDVEYAKDMALIPAKGETLYIRCKSQDEGVTEYVIPDGYGLWLKHKNEHTVPLRFYRSTGVSMVKHMDLTFNVQQDLSRFASMISGRSSMDSIGIAVCDENESGNWKNVVYFQSEGERANSHLFRIVPTRQLDNDTVSAFQHEYERLYPSDLGNQEYAKHLVVTTKREQSLRLFWQRDNGAVSEYSLPSGYSVWLQYRWT